VRVGAAQKPSARPGWASCHVMGRTH
jgi:hypothetical protein